MATAWTTPLLEIVLIRGDFFCLRVVVVTDVETGEEKRSCWCVANIIILCVYFFVRRFGPQRQTQRAAFCSAELFQEQRREKEGERTLRFGRKDVCGLCGFLFSEYEYS